MYKENSLPFPLVDGVHSPAIDLNVMGRKRIRSPIDPGKRIGCSYHRCHNY